MKLTPEQRLVVEHPLGRHARVIAVAGSGKTTTMAERVKHLIVAHNVQPKRLLVLMFNRAARDAFKAKLRRMGTDPSVVAQIHTFHSFAHRFLPRVHDKWYENDERWQLCVRRAIRTVANQRGARPEEIDVDLAVRAIGLWKGGLVPATLDRAGCNRPYLPDVYRVAEGMRKDAQAVTYDDFAPSAVAALEAEGYSDPFDHIIVDEYQDINYGQQRLIQLVAGSRADVMVVGDDDQTIYEWRGARPEYIRDHFPAGLPPKPADDYQLSHSFRFGPLLASCAQNLLTSQHLLQEKRIIAHNATIDTEICIIEGVDRPGAESPTATLAERVAKRWQELCPTGTENVESRIAVLGRTFAQLAGMEYELLKRGIPYRVVGSEPFYHRRECVRLLAYLRLAVAVDDPLTDASVKLLSDVLNFPSRFVSTADFTISITRLQAKGLSVREALSRLSDDKLSPFPESQRNGIGSLHTRIERLNELAQQPEPLSAFGLLESLVEWLNLDQYFLDYYGDGEPSEERRRTIQQLCVVADDHGGDAPSFLQHIDGFDPGLGYPVVAQVAHTTIHRTKGLEYETVVIPDCNEGAMPMLREEDLRICDLNNPEASPAPSDLLNQERRLMYVGITRARNSLWIGAGAVPALGAELASQPLVQSTAVKVTPSRFIEELCWLASVRLWEVASNRSERGPASFHTLALNELRAAPRLGALLHNYAEYYLEARGFSPSAINTFTVALRELLLTLPVVPESIVEEKSVHGSSTATRHLDDYLRSLPF